MYEPKIAALASGKLIVITFVVGSKAYVRKDMAASLFFSCNTGSPQSDAGLPL